MKTYSWGFFWENGEKATFFLPFGPVNEENPGSAAFIDSLDDPWVDKMAEYYPNLRDMLAEIENWSFAMILVNPPYDSTPAEIEKFKEHENR